MQERNTDSQTTITQPRPQTLFQGANYRQRILTYRIIRHGFIYTHGGRNKGKGGPCIMEDPTAPIYLEIRDGPAADSGDGSLFAS